MMTQTFADPLRRLMFGLFLLTLAGCSASLGPEALTPVSARAPDAEVTRIFLATTRAPLQPDAAVYGNGFSSRTHYAYFDISVPHQTSGKSRSYAWGRPDPAEDFVVVGSGTLSHEGFLQAIESARAPGDDSDVAVYVHGYYRNPAQSLFRLARLTSATGSRSVPVLFSWPSQGKPLEYMADQQAALYSRDALSALLTDLTAQTPKVLVLAHSMGAFLTVEALRDLTLMHRQAVLNRLQVVLAAPDIDLYVFAEQMSVIGPMRNPMVVLVSPDDRALALSSRIAGGRPRLGAMNVTTPGVEEAAQRANVQIIDISSVRSDPSNHKRFIQLAESYASLANDMGRGTDPRTAGAYILNDLDRKILLPVTAGASAE